jgi:hypothetical protein
MLHHLGRVTRPAAGEMNGTCQPNPGFVDRSGLTSPREDSTPTWHSVRVRVHTSPGLVLATDNHGRFAVTAMSAGLWKADLPISHGVLLCLPPPGGRRSQRALRAPTAGVAEMTPVIYVGTSRW